MRVSTTLLTTLGLILTLTGSAFSQPNTTTATTSSTSIATPVPPRPCTPQAVGPRRQQEIFNNFVNSLYVAKTVDEAYTHFTENFTQHNPDVLDGLAASFDFVDPLFTNPAVAVEVLHQGFEAPIGWVHWRIDGFLPQPTAVVDVYLWGGSCIVEHWDIVQERPVNATNPHALF
ncbi:hypothetical protein B0H11DRAFT_1958552 [Mycena galericulata]|nr:hypothetical protein B0H11DRAFT_1958552 [Mycena galericulata]